MKYWQKIFQMKFMDAKEACTKLNINGKNDWRLPSKEELLFMYSNKGEIGGFCNGFYCSAEDALSSEIYALNFQVGHGIKSTIKDINFQESFKLYSNYYTRPVRSI